MLEFAQRLCVFGAYVNWNKGSLLLRGLSMMGIISLASAFLLNTTVAPRLGAQEEPARKVTSRVLPKYPMDLKMHGIGGTVRLSVEVTPQGNVHKVTPLGGNPILIDAAVDAVKQWKYAPSDKSDTLEVKVDFNPKL